MARGSIRKRGKSYEVRVRAGRDPVTGKPVRLSRTARTREEARQVLADLLIQAGKGPPPTEMTLWVWLDHWLQDGMTRGWAPTTTDRYRRLMEQHARPLGHVMLSDLKPLHIQARLNELLDEGLASTTVNNFFRALRASMNRAVELGLLQTAPTVGVRPPKPKSRTDAAITAEQAAAIVRKAREADSRWWLAILLALSTGLRRGEVLGLRWSDLDLEEGSLQVRQTVVEVESRPVIQAIAKTPHSRRTVWLDDTLSALLISHRRQQAQERLKAGPDWDNLDLVFPSPTGRPPAPSRFSRAFKKYARDAGVPDARLHDSRHTHASTLLADGWPITAVAERLGHATPSVTAQIYSHAIPGMQRHLIQGGGKMGARKAESEDAREG